MANIYFFSGPCGCGKSTLSEAFAKKLVNEYGRKQVYLIHGDDFHQGFIESDDKDVFFADGKLSNALEWLDILKFNWECILDTADKVLKCGLDVVIDYVIETELSRVINLANRNGSDLYYVVLTASEEAIKQRITGRGDVDMIERALFLKNELENMPENNGHLFDNSNMSLEEELISLKIENFKVNT